MAQFVCGPYELVKVELKRKWASVELMELLKWIKTFLVMTSRFWIKWINSSVELFTFFLLNTEQNYYYILRDQKNQFNYQDQSALLSQKLFQ